MKKIFLSLSLFLFLGVVSAQVTDSEESLKTQKNDSIDGWHFGGVAAINFSQTAMKNWAAGGLNSFSLNGMGSVYANLKKGKSTWDNTLDIGYGLQQQGKGEYIQTLKTDDKIDFASKFGRKAFKSVYYAGLVNFKTQFTDGYNYPTDSASVPISGFLAPAYFLAAAGLDYKPNSNFTLFLAPLTSKITIVTNQLLADSGAYGVEPAKFSDTGAMITSGENTRYETGGYLKSMFKADLMKNVSFQIKADFFSNYLENPLNIDINAEALLNMKVNKYITASISSQLIYDDDIDIELDTDNDNIIDHKGPRIQFKEVLAIGVSVKF